jgi:hypothetical protein
MRDKEYFVYLIHHKGAIVYVGMTNNLGKRLKQHMESSKVFDEVKYYKVECKRSAQSLEAYLIDYLQPKLNITKGTEIKVNKGKEIFNEGLELFNFEGFDYHKASRNKLEIKDRGIYATYKSTISEGTVLLRLSSPTIGILEIEDHYYKLVNVVNVFSSYEGFENSKELTSLEVRSANGFICKPCEPRNEWDFKTETGYFYLTRVTTLA